MVAERVRFERHGRAATFVEVERQQRLLLRTFGRIGGFERERLEEHPTDVAAGAAFSQQLRRLESKGYVAGCHEPGLLQAIRADPDRPGPYLVYADWLIERGDPRGELIMRMAAGRSAHDLLVDHPVQLEPAWFATLKAEPVWRLGFLQRITLHQCSDLSQIRRLLRHPSAAVLQELVFARTPFGQEPDWELALRDRPATLQRIVLRGMPGFVELKRRIPQLVVE